MTPETHGYDAAKVAELLAVCDSIPPEPWAAYGTLVTSPPYGKRMEDNFGVTFRRVCVCEPSCYRTEAECEALAAFIVAAREHFRPLLEQRKADAEEIARQRKRADDCERQLCEISVVFGGKDARHVEGDGEHTVAAMVREQVQRLTAEVERLRQAAQAALDSGMGCHDHWDDTMQHGLGCRRCIAQREAARTLRTAIDAARKGE